MPDKNKDVLVLIPVYKKDLTVSEKQSLKRTLQVLGEYPIAFIKPQSLDFHFSFKEMGLKKSWEIEQFSFDDSFFASTDHYNRLLLSSEFYRRFVDYRYLLICQLDVYIFKNNLAYWLGKKFDYIGSPWIGPDEKQFLTHAMKTEFYWLYKFSYGAKKWLLNKKDYTIGNGGLSLRKVKKFLFITRRYKKFINTFKLNEDIFWSMNAPLLYPLFRIPNLQEGLGFAFEKDPAYFYKLNKDRLPFGCHAWEKYDPEFWEKFIKE